MINWNRLFRTPTYWIEKIQNDLFGHVASYLEKTGKSKQDFANDLGVSKGYVSQILNGQFDHKLSKLVELYLSIGMTPLIIGADLNAYASAMAKGASQNEFLRDLCIEEKPNKISINSESYISQEKPYYPFETQVPYGNYLNTHPMGLGAQQAEYKPQMPPYVGSELKFRSTQQNTALAYH
jgi:transcriptional regulator with XRE-family HTH domain